MKPLFLLVVALTSSCFLRTTWALDKLNEPSSPADPNVPTVDLQERIARLARTHFVDAYTDPAQVASWLESAGKSAEIVKILGDLRKARVNHTNPATIYDRIARGPTDWQVPMPPANADALKPPLTGKGAGVELDAERFLANATGFASSLLALETLVGAGPLDADVVTKGVEAGAARAAAYITRRTWRRRIGRPSTAIVLSGGAANGAFSAGVIWRLLNVLSSCRGVAEDHDGCAGVHVDLVAGTSTGSLIGTMIDACFAASPGSTEETHALDLLLGKYTCSVPSDLYCVNSTWIWKLFSDVRGLVRFDRIEQLLRDPQNVPQSASRNAVEMVAVSIDYETGDVFANSDQDPNDSPSPDRRVAGTLASIVEPVLSEPVDGLPQGTTKLKGTYVDGGVRSGLPVLQAVYRGAERALILTNSGIEPSRSAQPKNALQMLMRTLDLFSTNPNVAEVQLAELTAVERRFLEYNACKTRLVQLALHDKATVEDFCQRTHGFERTGPGVAPHLQAAETAWLGPARFPQVATSWQSSWVFRPETSLASASGYAFDPVVTQPLFLAGVKVFQDRCGEILDLLDVRGAIARKGCDEKDAVDNAKALLKAPKVCKADKEPQRSCE